MMEKYGTIVSGVWMWAGPKKEKPKNKQNKMLMIH